jgi:hypothetical protein
MNSSTLEIGKKKKLKSLEEGNSILNETCLKLKLSTFTRSIAQVIYQKCFPLLGSTPNVIKKLAVTSVYFSAKLTDTSVNLIKSPTSNSMFDVGIEMKICRILSFNFEFLNVYGLVKEINRKIHFSADDHPACVKKDCGIGECLSESANAVMDGVIVGEGVCSDEKDCVLEKLKKIDRVFSSEKINKISILNDSLEGVYLGLAVFSDEEINLLESILLVELDRNLLQRMREIVI